VWTGLERCFLPDTPGFAPGKNAGTIVVSDAVWRTAFDADRKILGQVVKINNDTYIVVGANAAGTGGCARCGLLSGICFGRGP